MRVVQPCIVKDHSGLHHALLAWERGGGGPGSLVFTCCLWPFVLGRGASLGWAAPPLYKDLCERCHPALRGERKRRLGRAAAGLAVSGGAGL